MQLVVVPGTAMNMGLLSGKGQDQTVGFLGDLKRRILALEIFENMGMNY